MTSGSNGLLIKPAEKADVPQILAMIRELAEFEELTHQLEADETQMTRSLFGDPKVAYALLLTWNGEPAGYCIYFYNFSTFLGRPGLYVEDLYVRPEFRRRGIARSVLIHLGQVAKAQNLGRIELAALDWNERAIRFYEGLGAQGLSEWKIFRFAGEPLSRLGDLEP
jgi:diamine N-acetyltransferase